MPPAPPIAAGPEEGLRVSSAAYQFIADLIYEHSRIDLGSEKHALVASRLGKRLRQLGLGCVDEYCKRLRGPQGEDELGLLVDLLSTNHTMFFREREHFDFMTGTILPEWHQRLVLARRPLRVWSAASSSGEEGYTISIVISEFLRSHGALQWELHGTDISTRVLEKARNAIYQGDALKQLPSPEILRRYFQRGVGEYEGRYRVRPELRQHATFHHLNLFQPQYPFPPGFQIIFCRNVMIYFDTESQQHLIDRLTQNLAPGGYLLVGHSESLLAVKHSLKQVRPSIYRRE